MWKIQRLFLLCLINYRKQKMLRLALSYGMSSVEVLNESIVVDRLLNKLKRLDHKRDYVKHLAVFRDGYQQLSKR